MICRSLHRPSLTLILVLTGCFSLCADDSATRRSTPIIFSTPRTDTVSSNLNQIGTSGTKRSPLTDLESGLKKPFEIFDSARPSTDFSTPRRYTPPAPVLNNQKLKDLLDKKAEQMYLSPDDNPSGLADDDPLKSSEDALDPATRRPKTQLDRYYDRIDQMKLAPTNQPSHALGLFGEPSEPGDNPGDFRTKGLFANEIGVTTRPMGVISNSNFSGGLDSAERTKPRSFGELFGLGPVESPQTTTRVKDSRLDDFKRLLDGPGYGSRSGFNVAPPPSASPTFQTPKPVVGVPSPNVSAVPASGASRSFEETAGFSGIAGTPKGLPDYALGTPSLTPTPPVQQAPAMLPPPTFNVPRRRF
jgi:hypothetical protein